MTTGTPSGIPKLFGNAPRMKPNVDKIRENRLRATARRQGLILAKSRRRDPRASDFGTFMLIDAQTNAVVASALWGAFGLSLDDIEDRLNS